MKTKDEVKNKVFKINEKMKIRDNKNVVMVFDPEKEMFYELNLTAGYILNLFDGKRTVSEIIEKTKNEFEGDKKTIEEDTLHIINEMITTKIIVPTTEK